MLGFRVQKPISVRLKPLPRGEVPQYSAFRHYSQAFDNAPRMQPKPIPANTADPAAALIVIQWFIQIHSGPNNVGMKRQALCVATYSWTPLPNLMIGLDYCASERLKTSCQLPLGETLTRANEARGHMMLTLELRIDESGGSASLFIRIGVTK